MPRTAATWDYPDAFTRLVALAASVTIFLTIVRVKPQCRFARDVIPFLFCANVYANLHDMIAYFGAADITPWLYRMDVALFGVEPTDLRVLVAVTATLAGIGLLACLVPARRATAVDPVRALSG